MTGFGSATTRDRVIELARSGRFQTMKCIGKHLRISKQRVQQILSSEGVSIYKRNTVHELVWPCPQCGEQVKSDTRRIKHRQYIYCIRCTMQLRYGRLGQPRFRDSYTDLVCPTCGKVRRYKGSNQYKIPAMLKSSGGKCNICSAKSLPHRRKSTCKRGHQLTEENVYHYATGARRCKLCDRIRHQNSLARRASIS